MVQVLGIVNLTRDSFSDGGQFLDPEAAVAHAQRLVADGADGIDLGAEATHPDAEPVPAGEELARLEPVLVRLKTAGVRVSVDTWKPEVMRRVLALGADFINDVTGLRNPEAVAAVRPSAARLIIMHSVASGPRAERMRVDPAEIVPRVRAFFGQRLAALTAAGIAAERLIIDPGMGLFLGTSAAASFAVLRALPELAAIGPPVLISTSRKSFTGALRGRQGSAQPVALRAAGTLASELWAAMHGAAYIRTHDVRALRDALAMWQAIESQPRS